MHNSILLLLVSVADEQHGLNVVANPKRSFLAPRPIFIDAILLWEIELHCLITNSGVAVLLWINLLPC